MLTGFEYSTSPNTCKLFGNCVALYFGVSNMFHCHFADFAGFPGGHFSVLELSGEGRVPCICNPLGFLFVPKTILVILNCSEFVILCVQQSFFFFFLNFTTG